MRKWRTRGLVALAALAVAGLATSATGIQLASARTDHAAANPAACGLANGIKHVIYIQFDNTHFRRDNPNVLSDLEQMPNLLDFMKGSGTLFTNDHTILISHTAGGILSSLTGLYPDRQGQTVSNSYDYYRNNGLPTFTSSFKYWTAPVDGADDPLPNMITDGQKNTPAPWVPFTRAGCDVGGVSTANMELENNSTAPGGDIANVYGSGSPEAAEPAALRTTDFVGIAIHCAQTAGSKCAGAAHAKDDLLPDEPGGYAGFKALFGTKYVDPAITGGNPCVDDTNGSPVKDTAGNCGFPGFDGMLAKNTLGYVAAMQKSGVPVTYAYISDAHDNHALARASGPGEQDYKQQLADYNDAFGKFFADLKANGIDKSNTLFAITVDEGDHFAGGTGTPDGSGNLTYSHTACPLAPAASTCPSNQIGEVNVKIGSVLPANEPGFDIHFDDAPTFYVNGDAGHPNGPARTDAAVRQLERDVWNASAPDPYAGGPTRLAQALADTVEEKTLHMVNSDPKRTPTFTMFGNPDFFFQTTNLSGGCAGSTVCVNPGFAWNHGDIQAEIGNTWLGLVGPGIAANGIDDQTWTDHTNVRPTILSLAGLKDDYQTDGRVLVEALTTKGTPQSLVAHRETVRRLGDAYEQLNAAFGSFAMDTLEASTVALASPDDATYNSIEDAIAGLTARRDALAAQIKSALSGAAFDGKALDEQQAKGWIDEANSLLDQAKGLSASSGAASVAAGKQLDKVNHVVVIYEENHSFDNLFGGWEGVNGRDNADAAHTTQVDQNGVAYGCLKQLDANLTSPPLPADCTDATHGITSHFGNTWFSIDDFIHPSSITCPPITNAFGFPNGLRDPGINPATNQPVPGARAGGCTRDLVHEFYQEQYQLNGGQQNRYMSGSDSAGTTMGVFDTTQLPLYRYLHEKGHPNYAIADNFFQAAFGGSFLNHQWLIAAATPVYPGAPANLHSIIDSNGMPTAYPLYTPTGTVQRNPLTVACPAPAAAKVCGDYAVNTMQPTSNPQGAFGAILPPQTAPTIGDELTAAGVDWAWYSGGWSNADGDVGAPGYTNGTSRDPNTSTGCSDPNVDTSKRNGVAVADWPRCPDALFQYHHQPFNYFANYAPGTPGRAHLQDEVAFENLATQSGDGCKLKPVSFVKPIGEENEHPGYASTPNGQDHLVSLLKAIDDSACAKDTMVIVTYDEFGGQWDHVSPPGQGNDNGPHDVWGPGTRIPALVIAPHLKGDFVVDSSEHDTTSILATIEHRFGLAPLGTRDAAVNDLSSVFDAKQPKK